MYTYHTYPTPLAPESGTPEAADRREWLRTVDGVTFIRSDNPGVFAEVWEAVGTHQLRATLTTRGTWYASAHGAPAVPASTLDEALAYLALRATV